MASPFIVSATTTTVALDQASRRGQVVLSVANASGRALRGRALVKAQDAAAQPWFSVVGEIERPFAVVETHQYTVQATVPPTAAAGTYLFRLDLVAEDRPNEDYTQGPSIALTVPAAVPPPRFPWWLIAVAALVVLLLLGTIAVLLVRGGERVELKEILQLPLRDGEEADLDDGRVGARTEADLQLDLTLISPLPLPGRPPLVLITRGTLTARNGARFARVGAEVDSGRACDAALKAASVSAIPVQDLPRGTRVCVLTNENRISLLEIERAVPLNQAVESSQTFSFQVTTWAP